MSDHPLIKKAVTELRAYFLMEVDDDPFRIFQFLEDAKDELPEAYQRLAIQEYCLKLICGDLAEHGKENLIYYAGGNLSERQFNELHMATFQSLITELKKTGAGDTAVWKAFGKIPKHIRDELAKKS